MEEKRILEGKSLESESKMKFKQLDKARKSISAFRDLEM